MLCKDKKTKYFKMNVKDIEKLTNVPLAKPGFDALGMSAPVLVQMNPDGKWERSKPGNLDEERLKAIVQHLVNSKAASAAQSYCWQCASECQTDNGKSSYVPIIMMPIIYPADQCPFGLECEIQKKEETEKKQDIKTIKKTAFKEQEKDSSKDTTMKKIKKRQFVMQQRLTDFDLLSQW